ncbi:MAG: glycosyltransferase family 2 protein [Candidatus Eremiobacteraeota bacterium]|nr:glycosyltransferase family 2 protein [Candidatus Eremiobacteraeota bacterium]
MNLVALTRVKIDGDIIEEFVRHTLQYVDELFVVDNVSPDSTHTILLALQDEGLPLTIMEDDYVEARVDLITAYAREIFARTTADYVLPLDADEFVRVESRDALETAFKTLAPSSHATVPWITYVPVQEEDRSEPRVLARIRYRLRRESSQFYKVLLSRSFANTPGAMLIPGSHDVQLPKGTPLPKAPLPGVALGHFPVRSVGQIQSKALLGWSAALAAGYDLVAGHDGDTGMASQWRTLYDRLRRHQDWSDDEFYRAAANYLGDQGAEIPELVYDPMSPVSRRFDVETPSVYEVAIEFIRQLAQTHARLAKQNHDPISE